MWCVIHSELMITGCHCSVDERRGQRKVYSNQGCCGKLLVPVAYRSMYFDFLLLPLARGDKHNAHALGARIAFFSLYSQPGYREQMLCLNVSCICALLASIHLCC